MRYSVSITGLMQRNSLRHTTIKKGGFKGRGQREGICTPLSFAGGIFADLFFPILSLLRRSDAKMTEGKV